MDEHATVLEVDRIGGLEALLRARTEAMALLFPDAPVPELTVAAALDVTDSRVLALLGSATTAGLSNAIRHARGMTAIAVSSDRVDDRVRLRVVNDGEAGAGEDPEAGQGLAHLIWQAHGLGGELRFGPQPGGGWAIELELPLRAALEPGQTLVSERMLALIDDALHVCVRLTAAMVASMALGGGAPRAVAPRPAAAFWRSPRSLPMSSANHARRQSSARC